MQYFLIALAVLFAFVHGLNTGASLLATSLTVRGLSLIPALLILTLGVAVAPFIFGTQVANTLAHELVPWGGNGGQLGMLIAVAVTVVTILILSFLRIPSSLTLALIGAISGYGFFALGTVEWGTVIKVLATMFLAPLIGGIIAFVIAKLVLPMLPAGSVRKYLEYGHRLAFTLLSFAYGSNDAQKMIAVGMIALGIGGSGVVELWPVIITGAIVFGLGSILGVRRMAKTISTGVLPASPTDLVTTEVSATTTMLISTSLGSPAGLAQTMSGALIGTGLSQGYGRIRWHEVSRILIAWVVTLPATFLIAGLIGALV